MTLEISSRPVVDFSKPYESSGLAEKSVLITGGASGLGAQMAATFAQLGQAYQ